VSPRVCLWSSGFQADTQALALHLGRRAGWDLTVVMERPERYLAEAVNRLYPLQARVLDRDQRGLARTLRQERFDLLIVDNHLPDEPIAPRLFVLWHGFGWRVDDLATMRKELTRLVGDPPRPHPAVRWPAFGDWDRDYRIRHSRLAPENVVALGSAYSDLLLTPGEPTARRPVPEDLRRRLQPAYPVDLSRPTILVGLTWHHGSALGQWGDDRELLGRLVDHAGARGANVLLRMHDRHRFDTRYRDAIERLAATRPQVRLTYRSDHPDSLADLLLSDLLISNYSSLLNAFYYTRRPTIHLDPHAPGQRDYVYRRWKRGTLREERVDRAEQVWKLDPGEVGGLRARSFEVMLEQLDQALDQPDCCVDLSRRFTDRYITGADGHTCERIAEFLEGWVEGGG